MRQGTSLRSAVGIVIVADLVMSLDNVIGVAAAAKGSLVLLVFGLVISIPLVVVGAQLIMKLIGRLPWLVIAGGGLLGYIAGEIAKYVRELERPAEFGRHPLARRRRLAKNPDRDAANRDGHALAIAVELREARRPNIGPRIHAINNGEEIVTPQIIEVYGFAQTAGHIVLGPTGKEISDFTAPVQ